MDLKMASCLVPDFPAVLVSQEHLQELDKLLREERIPFAPEASPHLRELTSAIVDLESERRAAHEHLEVETIENSKLRQQINSIREHMSQEVKADVAAVRASNAEEMEQLHQEINAVCHLREAAEKKQEVLQSQNTELQPHREQEKAEHDKIVAVLNNEISLKYVLQMQLEQKQEQIDELKVHIAAVEQEKISLKQNTVLEREAFDLRKRNMSDEVKQTEEKIKQQKQVIRRRKRELERVKEKKEESHGCLGELTSKVTKVESNLQSLTAARCLCEKQLEEESGKRQDLSQQRETLKKNMFELGETFTMNIQSLKEKIAVMERKLADSEASQLFSQDHLTNVCEMFQKQHEEERKIKVEHSKASQQLETSRLHLDEQIASVVSHNKEIREMDKQIRELLEAETVSKRVFEKSQEELCVTVDTEKKNIRHFEKTRNRLRRLLVEKQRAQEQHEAKKTSDFTRVRRSYEELQEEEAELHRRNPGSTDADHLMGHVTQCVAENTEVEMKLHQEIMQCTTETESIARDREEKQKEAEEDEETLKEVEAKWSEEQNRQQRLGTQISELRRRRTELEVSAQELKEKATSLLQPREQMKSELERKRADYMDLLVRQASELRALEQSIYNTKVKLGQVRVENSRLHLHIRQMMEDVSRVRLNTDRYWQHVNHLYRDKEAMFQMLQEAWCEDMQLTEESQSSDGSLLVGMSALLDQLKTRRQQTGHVNNLLHQKMLDFSRRLGDGTTGSSK